MAENRAPVKRNDVIRCENCGEDYSVTYKRCPFCDELRGESQRTPARSSKGPSSRSSGGKRMAAGGGYGGGYGGGNFDLLRIIGIVVPLALIVAAIYIIITVLGPMITAGHGENPSSPNTDTAAVNTDSTNSPDSSPSGSDTPQPSDPVVTTPTPDTVTAITLDQSDFTLPAGDSHKINAALTPANGGTVTWSVDKPEALSIGQDGTATNINASSSTVTVTVTATCGNVSATCLVRCRGGSSGTVSPDPSPSASTAPSGSLTTGSAVISGAGSGLRVRSGPGTSYEILASLVNGNSVTIQEIGSDGWCKITFDAAGGAKVTGYVLGEYLSNR